MSSINVTSFFISCTEDITELSWTGNSTKLTQINITNQSYLIYILKPLKNIFILSHLKKHFQSAEFYIEKNNIKTSIFHSQSFLSLFSHRFPFPVNNPKNELNLKNIHSQTEPEAQKTPSIGFSTRSRKTLKGVFRLKEHTVKNMT